MKRYNQKNKFLPILRKAGFPRCFLQVGYVGQVSLLILFIILSSFPVLAAEKNSLQLYPAIIEKEMQRGDNKTEKIKVFNNSSQMAFLKVVLKDFEALGEEGEQNFVAPRDPHNKYSLSKWLKIKEEKIFLNPQENKEISFAIDIPENAPPGGYYSVIFLEKDSSPTDTLDNISIISQTGSLIFVNISGEINYSAQLISFSADKKIYYQSNPLVRFSYRVKNDSDTYIKPIGNITIKNWLGMTAAQFDANNTEARILPESIRKLSNSWQPRMSWGKYNANLKFSYGNNKIVEDKISFWIIPLRESAIFVVISLLIVVQITKSRKEKKR